MFSESIGKFIEKVSPDSAPLYFRAEQILRVRTPPPSIPSSLGLPVSRMDSRLRRRGAASLKLIDLLILGDEGKLRRLFYRLAASNPILAEIHLIDCKVSESRPADADQEALSVDETISFSVSEAREGRQRVSQRFVSIDSYDPRGFLDVRHG